MEPRPTWPAPLSPSEAPTQPSIEETSRRLWSHFDAQIEWTEPAEFPGGGIYHGREAVKRYLAQSRSSWAEGSSEPERFITAGNRIVVFVHVRARSKGRNEWNEVRLADVYTIRDGQPVEMRAFADRKEALRWAGVKDPNP
jgi:uncharacterized protein